MILPEKTGAFSASLNLGQPPEDHRDRQHAADALAQKRRPRNAGYAHLKHRDEQNVDKDVGKRRCGQKPERRFGVAQRRENTRRNIVEKDERKTEHIIRR